MACVRTSHPSLEPLLRSPASIQCSPREAWILGPCMGGSRESTRGRGAHTWGAFLTPSHKNAQNHGTTCGTPWRNVSRPFTAPSFPPHTRHTLPREPGTPLHASYPIPRRRGALLWLCVALHRWMTTNMFSHTHTRVAVSGAEHNHDPDAHRAVHVWGKAKRGSPPVHVVLLLRVRACCVCLLTQGAQWRCAERRQPWTGCRWARYPLRFLACGCGCARLEDLGRVHNVCGVCMCLCLWARWCRLKPCATFSTRSSRTQVCIVRTRPSPRPPPE